MHVSKRSFLLSQPARNKLVFRTSTINKPNDISTGHTIKLKSWKEIPGPLSLPIIGQLLNFLPGGDEISGAFYNIYGRDFFAKAYKMYGPIIRLKSTVGTPHIIMLIDPESSERILRSENLLPERPGLPSLEYFRKQYKAKGASERSTGLLTEHGDKWKEFRAVVNPVMMQPKTIRLYTDALDEVAVDMISKMKSVRDENCMIKKNFDLEMNLWALESIGLIALGERINCFDPNLADDSPARTLINSVHDFFKVTFELDFKPSIWRIYPTKAFKEGMKLYERQANAAKYFVDRAFEKMKTKNKGSNEENSVLEKLLEIDEDIALTMALDMLVAGVDTSANTIMFTLYLLAKNPEKQEKLRTEIMSKEQKRPYLKACLKESLRMLPVVTGNIRRVTKDYDVMGYKIPKGLSVFFAHSLMTMDESQFPRPEEYLPERWIVNSDDPLYYRNAHPFAYNPFGFGVRSCIGRRIAELEIEIFLARLVENFKIDWVGDPIKISSLTLNYAKGPFNYIFTDV